MKLSIDAINEKSPLWVLQLDDMLFRFVTRNGIRYRAGFYPDKYFLESGAYHFSSNVSMKLILLMTLMYIMSLPALLKNFSEMKQM